MATLKEFLLAPGNRPRVIADCERLVDQEVGSKSGLGGLAVRGAYAVVKRVKPGIIPDVIDNLLDDFVAQLEPFFAAFLTGAQPDLVPVFSAQDVAIANALLTVTDARAARTQHATLKTAYEKLRPTGVKHTAAAVPNLARLIKKYV